MAKPIERLDNMLKGISGGWVDDWEIVNCMDDDMAEEWSCMLSDMPIDAAHTTLAQATLARANQFLIEHESIFRVFDVAESKLDEYCWAFVLA